MNIREKIQLLKKNGITRDTLKQLSKDYLLIKKGKKNGNIFNYSIRPNSPVLDIILINIISSIAGRLIGAIANSMQLHKIIMITYNKLNDEKQIDLNTARELLNLFIINGIYFDLLTQLHKMYKERGESHKFIAIKSVATLFSRGFDFSEVLLNALYHENQSNKFIKIILAVKIIFVNSINDALNDGLFKLTIIDNDKETDSIIKQI